MAIGNLTTGNSNQMGGLLVVERLPVPLLPFVCQHRLHSAFPPPLANVANGLLGDLQIKSDLGIGEAIIAFEQHPPSRQRARIGFASTDKDLDMASFFFTEAHWSGSSHLFFSFLSSVYHKNPIGLTTRKFRIKYHGYVILSAAKNLRWARMTGGWREILRCAQNDIRGDVFNIMQIEIRKWLKSPRVRTGLGVATIAVLVVCTFLFAPKEEDPNVGLVNDPTTPTVGITNLLATLTVNRGVQVQGVKMTVTRVQEATAFSDDRKRGGSYIVRVSMQTVNTGQNTVGIRYDSIARLLLPDGEVVVPKLVNLSPAALPQVQQDGYIDFALSNQVDLSSLRLRLGNETIAFG